MPIRKEASRFPAWAALQEPHDIKGTMKKNKQTNKHQSQVDKCETDTDARTVDNLLINAPFKELDGFILWPEVIEARACQHAF